MPRSPGAATQTPFSSRKSALVDEMEQRLAEEERVAVGLGREQRRELRRDVVAGQALQQREHVVGVEPVERDARRLDLPLQQRQRGGERMTSVEIGLAVGPDDDEAGSSR